MPLFGRRKRTSADASTKVSHPADPRFAVQDETLEYTAPQHLPFAVALPFSVAPSGTLKILHLPHQKCPGFVPPPTLIRIEYDIPAGTQKSYHPNPGVRYPSTVRYAYLPNDDSGCKLLTRFKVAWNHGYMFKIGKSLTSGLDNQVVWTSIPNKTSLQGGPFGFPDTKYISKAHTELDKLGIPSADECLFILSTRHSSGIPFAVVLPSSNISLPAANPNLPPAVLPPAQNPSFVPPSITTLTPSHTTTAQSAATITRPAASLAPAAPIAPSLVVSAPPATGATIAAPATDTVAFEQIFYSAPSCLASTITPDLFEPISCGDDECSICLDKVGLEKSVKIKACQHEFHMSCLQDSLKHNPRCPVCRKPVESARGKSPSGTMTIELTDEDCPGFGTGVKAIRITYKIPGGIQKDFHENPNQSFDGTTRVAYLPHTTEGRKLLKRFKYAWRHGLTFRVGRSRTTGLSNQVTWTSIHHKTSLCG